MAAGFGGGASETDRKGERDDKDACHVLDKRERAPHPNASESHAHVHNTTS